MIADVSTYSRELAALSDLALLPDKPEETHDTTLRALWHAAAGKPLSVALATTASLPALDAAGMERLSALVQERRAGRPLAHITGRQRFMDLEFLVDARALIPRRETELLATAALDIARQTIAERGAATHIDVCCGAGNIALSLAHHAPLLHGFAADLSAEAVSLAIENRARLGLDGRVELRPSDLFRAFEGIGLEGTVDVVTCNPPYIASKNVEKMAGEISGFEPRLAFDGGPFGIGIISRALTDALKFLRPGGWFCMEVGKGQGAPLVKMIQRNKSYGNLRTVCDEDGDARSLIMQRVAVS